MALAKGSSTGKVGGRAYGTGKKGFPTRGPVPYNSGGSGRGSTQSSIRGKSVVKSVDKSYPVSNKMVSNKAKSIATKAAKRAGAEGPKRSAPVKKKGTR